jgi:2-polyprenyl-6-methoxyphenol hydroxylase-like FAD-dependent oxidoreductase
VALSKLGLDDVLEIDIYEAATKLAQVGAGITVLPRAWDILKKLGLEKALSERSPTSKAAELEDEQGLLVHYYSSENKSDTFTSTCIFVQKKRPERRNSDCGY